MAPSLRMAPPGRRKVVDVAGGGLDLAAGAHALERAALGHGCEEGHWAAAIGDLDRLAALDEAEQLTGALPKLSDADPRHALLVAHAGLAAMVFHLSTGVEEVAAPL